MNDGRDGDEIRSLIGFVRNVPDFVMRDEERAIAGVDLLPTLLVIGQHGEVDGDDVVIVASRAGAGTQHAPVDEDFAGVLIRVVRICCRRVSDVWVSGYWGKPGAHGAAVAGGPDPLSRVTPLVLAQDRDDVLAGIGVEDAAASVVQARCVVGLRA